MVVKENKKNVVNYRRVNNEGDRRRNKETGNGLVTASIYWRKIKIESQIEGYQQQTYF